MLECCHNDMPQRATLQSVLHECAPTEFLGMHAKVISMVVTANDKCRSPRKTCSLETQQGCASATTVLHFQADLPCVDDM